jgi:multiple sugar transport system ATP-binding protein
MGRAIVRDPKAFLMDEPLSNLDAKLRVQMRAEVARLQDQLKTTMVYVTHDQTEAMTLGDRVAVMRAGELQQVGSPAELYNDPQNLFVAGFIGSPAMNFMPAELSDGRVKLPIGEVDAGEATRHRADGPLVAGMRPESFEQASLVSDDLKRGRGVIFKAEIDLIESLGSDLYAYFHIESEGVESEQLADLVGASLDETGAASLREGEEQVIARLDASSKVRRGEEAELWADTTQLHLFDPESGANLAREAAAR